MSTASAPPRLRLRTPEDVLAAVPYLLGFHPSDSLVVLGLRGKRLIFHVRGDLAPAGADRADVADLAEYYVDVFQAHRVSAVLLAGFGTGPRVTPLMDEVRRAMLRRGIEVREALRADGERYWSYLCQRADCCPPEGTRYETSGSAVAAAATVAGCVALPDRDTVVRSLAAPVGLALVAIEQATARVHARMLRLVERPDADAAARATGRDALCAALDRYTAGGRLSDDELAWLSVLLWMEPVRDIAWRRIDRDWRDGPDSHERLWTDVVRRCDPAFVAPAAMLLSYVMWRSGDGVRARIAVDRALASDPDYSAARLMAEVLDQALPPSGLVPAPRRRRGRRRSRRSRR